MKPMFKCEISYHPSLHLNQLYDGFEKLRKIGFIDLVVRQSTGNQTKPILKVVIDNKHIVIYDTLDGMNWIDGSIEENLNYFKSNIKSDFYFKRSYNEQILENAPEDCKVYPLGLNYNLKPEGRYPKGLKEGFKDFIKSNSILSRYYSKSLFYSRDFEFYPIPAEKNKILFLTRLWNPDEVVLEHLKVERELINNNRIDCIRACQKEFGKTFTGGIQNDNFSTLFSKDLIVPMSVTNKKAFLNTIKQSNICIGTTGLHDSIGWKFAEYVAASRAIITEPLKYEVPGEFENKKNYLMYNNKDELIENIQSLLKSKDKLYSMMNNNFHYYNNYVRSDYLILNTLLKVYQNN